MDDFFNEIQKFLKPDIDTGEALNGRSLKELFDTKLKELGLTKSAAASLLNIERRTIDSILDKTAKRIDVLNVVKLSKFLNISTNDLLGVFLNELVSPDTFKEFERSEKLSYILNNFDIKNLHKAGFIKDNGDYEAIEKRINEFFGLEKISEYSQLGYFPAYSRTRKSGNDYMRDFWVRSAYQHFQKINNIHPYDRDKLIDLLPKIRPYNLDVKNGLKIVTQALYSVGVTLIYQPHLTTTQVRGATFIVNDKPCIVLTDLNKNYATLWFALIHELHHVLYDLDTIQKQTYHLTGDYDLLLLEDKADNFAREFLFKAEDRNYIYPHIANATIVNEYSREAELHPSIVYNFFCWDMEQSGKANWWGRFKPYLPNINLALNDLNVSAFEKGTIAETVTYLKQKVFNL